MNIRQACKRFREFGGLRLVWQYARMGLLWPAAKALAAGLLRERSIKAAYARLIQTVEHRLAGRYGHILHEAKVREKDADKGDRRGVPHILWTCWLQGMGQAPPLVRQCVASQRACFPDCEHRVLTLSNYSQWVDIPKYIERKYRRGRIPAALFSDVLRLAVLKKYGGVWMDATVLCTGFGTDRLQRRWHSVMKSTMTVCRYFNPRTKAATGVSNWFIVATPHNAVVEAVYDMLLAYWQNYDCTVDYYMMHLFLEMSQTYFPDIWAAMPRIGSRNALLLGRALGTTYRKEQWEELTAHVCIHKLNYRKVGGALKHADSYCARLLAMDFSKLEKYNFLNINV